MKQKIIKFFEQKYYIFFIFFTLNIISWMFLTSVKVSIAPVSMKSDVGELLRVLALSSATLITGILLLIANKKYFLKNKKDSIFIVLISIILSLICLDVVIKTINILYLYNSGFYAKYGSIYF